MADMPADAPRSEDGQWWWDGSQWQPVTGASTGGAGGGATAAAPATSSDPAQSPATPASGQLSDDGQWRWDGSQWQPAQADSGATQTSAAESAASSQDPNERTVTIDMSQFPTIYMYSQFNTEDELLTSLGVDVSTLQHDDDTPVA